MAATEIKIEDAAPYVVAGQKLATLRVKSIGFNAFVESRIAAAAGGGTEREIAKRDFRGQIARQVEGVTADGKVVSLDDAAVSEMPATYALRLKGAMNAALFPADAGTPEVLGKGDLLRPWHVKLGTPIAFAGSKPGSFAEVEFVVSNLAGIEDLLVCDTELEQTVALLELARPVGGESNLASLPSWAIDQISVRDGVFVMSEVLRPLLASGASS